MRTLLLAITEKQRTSGPLSSLQMFAITLVEMCHDLRRFGTRSPGMRCFNGRCRLIINLEVDMPIILWLLGVPLVVVVLLMLTHII